MNIILTRRLWLSIMLTFITSWLVGSLAVGRSTYDPLFSLFISHLASLLSTCNEELTHNLQSLWPQQLNDVHIWWSAMVWHYYNALISKVVMYNWHLDLTKHIQWMPTSVKITSWLETFSSRKQSLSFPLVVIKDFFQVNDSRP